MSLDFLSIFYLFSQPRYCQAHARPTTQFVFPFKYLLSGRYLDIARPGSGTEPDATGANDRAVIAVDLVAYEPAIGVEIMIALQRKTRTATAPQGKRPVVPVTLLDVKVDAAWITLSVSDVGKLAAGVRSAV